MGNVGSTDKSQTPRPRPVSSSPGERQPLLKPALTGGGSAVVGLGGHSKIDFEDYARSGEKPKKSQLTANSSPPRMEQPVALESLFEEDDPSAKDLPLEEKSYLYVPEIEDPASLPEIKRIPGPLERYRRSSEIPSQGLKEYGFWIKSEMIKEDIRSYFDVSLKSVNGTVQVDFSRRFRGSGFPVDQTRLQQAIQRAERLMESPVVAETAPWDPDDRIKIKRTMHKGQEFIELINVPPDSSVADVVQTIHLHCVRRMYDGQCLSYDLRSSNVEHRKEMHAFRVVPDGKKRREFKEVERRKYEDEILKMTMREITILHNAGHDIHRLDEDMKGALERSVMRDLKKELAIDFRRKSTSPVVKLDA